MGVPFRVCSISGYGAYNPALATPPVAECLDSETLKKSSCAFSECRMKWNQCVSPVGTARVPHLSPDFGRSGDFDSPIPRPRISTERAERRLPKVPKAQRLRSPLCPLWLSPSPPWIPDSKLPTLPQAPLTPETVKSKERNITVHAAFRTGCEGRREQAHAE